MALESGISLPKLVYLAGPLDQLDSGFDPDEWKKDAQIAGALSGICCVWCPKQQNPDFAAQATLANRSLIFGCDGVLANLNGGFPFGTIREIEFAAYQLGKPVVVVSAEKPASFMMHDLMWAHDLANGMQIISDSIDSRRRTAPVDWTAE